MKPKHPLAACCPQAGKTNDLREVISCHSLSEPARAPWPALDEIDEQRVDSFCVGGHFSRERARLVVVSQEREIGHAHRVDDAVAVIAFVLQKRRPGTV